MDDEFFGDELERAIAGARLAAQHAFDSPLAGVPNDWVVGAFADYRQTDFSGGFGAEMVTDTIFSAWARVFVIEDVYLEVSANQIMSETDFGGFTTENEEMVFAVQAGWEF